MKNLAGEGLDDLLQAGQSERLGQYFEHHGPVGQLSPQPLQRGRRNAAVVEGQRHTDARAGGTLACPRSRAGAGNGPVAGRRAARGRRRCRLTHDPELVRQLVTVQDPHRVPEGLTDPEGQLGPLSPGGELLRARTGQPPRRWPAK